MAGRKEGEPAMTESLGLAALLFVAALLYTSVGHAGASGYLAAMAVYGLAPDEMRPAVLILNLFAATLTTVRFYSAGHFDRGLFLPLAAGSVPAAYLGGLIVVAASVYYPLLAAALLVAAVRLAWPSSGGTTQTRRMPVWAGVVAGVAIGLLAGLTGVGGGIYLTPLLLFFGWSETRQAAGVSAAFILVNSAAALLGRLTTFPVLPSEMPAWVVVVLAGSAIGSTLGSRVLGSATLRRILAVVLVIAAAKLLFG
jgi:uncharacterized membrane protein YfcA